MTVQLILNDATSKRKDYMVGSMNKITLINITDLTNYR